MSRAEVGGPALARAEVLLRRGVVRVAPGSDEQPATSPRENETTPWFASPQHCLDTIASLVGGGRLAALAFGGRWPALELDRRVLAPGIPTSVGTTPREGADGNYWRDGDELLRSAFAGAERVLVLTEGADPPGCAADLVWFGDAVRYVLADGDLTVEDRFCRLRVAADVGALERELVRRRRVDPTAISGLPTRPGSGPARIEVRRETSLLQPGIWEEPDAVLGAREGVEHAALAGDRARLRLNGGATVELVVTAGPEGWRAERLCGEWPYLAVEIAHVGTALSYTAELDPRIDPLRPGARMRLAFDLGSDLVVLGP